MENQPEFVFADDPGSVFYQSDPRASFYAEVSALWQIPVGELIHVALRDHSFAELYGRLELAQAPDLPLDRRETLSLRIGTIDFTHCQVVAWSLR